MLGRVFTAPSRFEDDFIHRLCSAARTKPLSRFVELALPLAGAPAALADSLRDAGTCLICAPLLSRQEAPRYKRWCDSAVALRRASLAVTLATWSLLETYEHQGLSRVPPPILLDLLGKLGAMRTALLACKASEDRLRVRRESLHVKALSNTLYQYEVQAVEEDSTFLYGKYHEACEALKAVDPKLVLDLRRHYDPERVRPEALFQGVPGHPDFYLPLGPSNRSRLSFQTLFFQVLAHDPEVVGLIPVLDLFDQIVIVGLEEDLADPDGPYMDRFLQGVGRMYGGLPVPELPSQEEAVALFRRGGSPEALFTPLVEGLLSSMVSSLPVDEMDPLFRPFLEPFQAPPFPTFAGPM